MPTAEKERTIEQAKEWYAKSSGVVFTDYRGLTVKEMQHLRRDLRAKGAEIHVIKNTLFRIAVGEHTNELPADLHNGTTAFAFLFNNEPEVAKALLDFARTSKKLVIKGGLFNGKGLTSKQVQSLSELPPREVLIAQVIGAIAAPLTSLIGTIEALYADPIRVIGAVADKVGGGTTDTATTSSPESESPEPTSPDSNLAAEPAAAESATSDAEGHVQAPHNPAADEALPAQAEPEATDNTENE